MMSKRRKGSDILHPDDEREALKSTHVFESSISGYPLEDDSRLKTMCQEDVLSAEPIVESCKNRLIRIAATAPPSETLGMVQLGKGHKRKGGCIDATTLIGGEKKFEDDYVKCDAIGRGKYGSVCLCRSRLTGVEFACKTLKKGEEMVQREVEIMQHLSGHLGIVTLEAVYEDDECFHLVMELCSGGRLVDQMPKGEKYSEHRAANIFKELMLVIKYCHEMGVAHRDIKPENILLTASGKMKLVDFGLAKRIANGQRLTGMAGSPGYMAPEVFSGHYSEKVDVWSAGVVLHTLLSGVLPFQGNSLAAVVKAIKNVKLDFHSGIWESVSKPARDLLERILTRDEASRITAEEVLSHPWISFYTEHTLPTLCVEPKLKNQSGVPLNLPATTSRMLDEDTSPLSSNGSLHLEAEEQDDFGLIDALAVAISHVRISAPKKSKLYGPILPMREQLSSNMIPNLCKAF